MDKGIVVKYLCTNPSCDLSETVISDKRAVVLTSGKCSFPVISSCPKCKSGVEMLNFVSGTVAVTEDKIEQKNIEEKGN